MRKTIPLLSLCVGVGATACNPLIYGKLLDDVYVTKFEMRGPTGTATHSPIALGFGPDENGEGHVLMASAADAAMVWLALSVGAEPVERYPTVEDLQALIFPLAEVQEVEIGGLAKVPSPEDGDTTLHAVVAFQAAGDPANARVVRFSLPAFTRTGEHALDMVNPVIGGAPVPSFGTGLAAINLDGPQDDAAYEVAVGSEAGVLVYDSVGANGESYQATKAGLNPAACADEADCFFFTHCAELANPINLTQGAFLGANSPAIAVATAAGLTFIAEADTPEMNVVGVPMFDCEKEFFAAPTGASAEYGRGLFVSDLDGDGNDDLAVGDPGANRVHIHMGSGAGLPATPTRTIEPGSEDAAEYGFSIGRADLGASIGSVLLVGAPGSNVDGEPQVGKVFVYGLTAEGEPIVVLADETPHKSTRFGLWAGGIRVGDHDELVVTGIAEAKIYTAITEDDPQPG